MSNQLTRRDFAIRTAGFALALGLAPAATLADAEQASRPKASPAVADPYSLVDPELRPILKQFPAIDLTAEMVGKFRQMPGMPPLPVPAPQPVERHIPGPPGAPEVRLWVVDPAPLEKGKPLLLHMHGGGFMMTDPTLMPRLQGIATDCHCVVVSVDYRRPPETRFPGAFEDGFAAVRDIFVRIAEFGGDNARVGVAGDSAGGNLAAAVAIACRDAGITLAAQLLVYPVTDVAGNFADAKENARFASRTENAEGYFLSRAVMQWFAGHYLSDAKHGADWRGSPLRAKSLAGLAPAIVCTAWFDPLRDEGKAYADALQAAGVATRYYHGAGLIHGYFGLGEASETARREAQRARADFKALLERGV